MSERPFRLKTWYGAPEQNLFRQEVRFAWRWLTGWPGVGWPVLYGLLLLLSYGFQQWFVLSRWNAGKLPIHTIYLISRGPMLIELIACYFVIYFVRNRTFLPFRKDRLPELLVTSIDYRSLWPGLLAGPLVIIMVFSLVKFAVSQLFAIYFFSYGFERIANSVPVEIRGFLKIKSLFDPLLQLMVHSAGFVALTAFAVWRSFPKGGYVRIISYMLLGYILIELMRKATVNTALYFAHQTRHSISGLLVFQILTDGGLLLFAVIMAIISFRGLSKRDPRQALQQMIENP